MPTSLQLFDDSGNEILEFHSQFVLEGPAPGGPAAALTVIGSIVAGSADNQRAKTRFQEISPNLGATVLYNDDQSCVPNADCVYCDTVAETIERELYARGVPFQFVSIEALAKFIERGEFHLWSPAGGVGFQTFAGLKSATRSI
jgi:hypothetical protein